MALVECPECTRNVSDRATTCPGCGYPIKQDLIRKQNCIREESQLQGESPKSRYIYILSNPSFGEGLFKIGKTTRTPAERARELSSHTGLPDGFEVEFSTWVSDCHEAEKMVHEALNKYRGSKEFFDVPLEKARKIVEAICSIFEVSDDPPADEKPPCNTAESLNQRTDETREAQQNDSINAPTEIAFKTVQDLETRCCNCGTV